MWFLFLLYLGTANSDVFRDQAGNIYVKLPDDSRKWSGLQDCWALPKAFHIQAIENDASAKSNRMLTKSSLELDPCSELSLKAFWSLLYNVWCAGRWCLSNKWMYELKGGMCVLSAEIH